jgi:hypothetical protein
MKLNSIFARGVAALALVGLMGAVHAGDVGSNTTMIKLLGKDKKLETVKFEGELEVGGARGLYTDAGTPVTVTRTDQGLTIEFADRSVEVPYPSASAAGEDGAQNLVIRDGAGEKNIVIVKRGEHGALPEGAEHHQKRVIVVSDGDGGNTDVDVDVRLGDLADLADLEVLADAHGEAGDGHEQVVVIRKVIKHDAAEAAQ